MSLFNFSSVSYMAPFSLLLTIVVLGPVVQSPIKLILD